MVKMHRRLLVLICLMMVLTAHGQTSQPVFIDATDKAGLTAALGQDVIVQGTVSKAEWSRTGAVMNIDFKGAEQSRMMAVVFQRQKAAFDTAYKGDITKALTGSKIRIKGTLEEYGGNVAAFKGRPQLILNRPDQITIMEPAP